jgi:glutathione synthase/RimK-type ligase-like ATP-grasp enzyme
MLDPNLTVLAAAAKRRGVDFVDIRFSDDASPSFHWDLTSDVARFNQLEVKPTSCFVRYNVFNDTDSRRPGTSARGAAWYAAVQGWSLAQRDVRVLNRHITNEAANKTATLRAAAQVGLLIPATTITNEETFLRASHRRAIAKPVAGGDFCYTLEESLERGEFRQGRGAAPAIVQNRLTAPEVRVYIVGKRAFAFEMVSASLDYRVRQDAEVIRRREPHAETELLRHLLSRLQMDFGAADFKTNPDDGSLIFLEMNSCPMFARFDMVAEGALCDAILDELVDKS